MSPSVAAGPLGRRRPFGQSGVEVVVTRLAAVAGERLACVEVAVTSLADVAGVRLASRGGHPAAYYYYYYCHHHHLGRRG
jgi:hypothetical protein